MPKFAIVLLTILIIMIIALIVLYFVGKRAQKKKEEQDAQIAAITSCPAIAAMPGSRLQNFADIRQITMYKIPSVAIAPRIWPYTSSETRCIDIQNAS